MYERAISNVPPAPEKRYWQRYVYLWIKYALWEELDAGEPERAREVYRACLKLLPHGAFTFGKVGGGGGWWEARGALVFGQASGSSRCCVWRSAWPWAKGLLPPVATARPSFPPPLRNAH